MILLSNCRTGTVPFLDILYKSLGLFFKLTSLCSNVKLIKLNASLARIAYGHLRNEYKTGFFIIFCDSYHTFFHF